MFEGISAKADAVYAYDLRITDPQGTVRQGRDAYSFLPTLGEVDMHLFAQGNERRIYEKLGQSKIRQLVGVTVADG